MGLQNVSSMKRSQRSCENKVGTGIAKSPRAKIIRVCEQSIPSPCGERVLSRQATSRGPNVDFLHQTVIISMCIV
jgi:hypothetical protein